MTTIIGVDFSGAWSDLNKTWVAQGTFNPSDGLRFRCVRDHRRMDLYELLAGIQPPAVVAMDFPFGVPAKFAAQLVGGPPPATMSEMWKIIFDTHSEDFIAARHRFLDLHGEPKRAGDLKYHRESYSPLHIVNPVMLAMTYAGVYLLHRLHQKRPNCWHVPPMAKPIGTDAPVTLLETMPGAVLKALKLPYKGYKGGRRALELRTRICEGLASQSGIPLPNLCLVRDKCLDNDDCLDAVVAAVGAAMWAQNSRRFRCPDKDELADAQLEGWIYAPC